MSQGLITTEIIHSRLLAVSLARQCQLLPDESAGLDTSAGLAGIGHIKY